ncbi:MAG: hypothetical protein PVI23_14595 [Maricaulaceae bacterium]|jgi:hypothetical protein
MARTRSVLAVLATLLVAGSGLSSSASGQAVGAGVDADITGDWTLQTKAFFDLCRITGEMTLRPTEEPDVYEGELYAHQRCGNGYVGYVEWRADQLVRAVREGDWLSITSTLVRVEPPSTTYAPDDFELQIVDSTLMMGELRSYLSDSDMPIGVVEAAFQRGDAPVS